MAEKLRVLIVEDNRADAALLVRELRRSWELTHEQVETAEAMRAALDGQTWDLIISDFAMPKFSAIRALELLRETQLDIPFIIVSGTIGEEAAVEAMRAGARDFMPKGKFSRLQPAIQRELKEAAARREHRAVEQRLRQSQKLETIGQLTGGIAHDFNNLLGVVVGNIDLLQEMVKDRPSVAELAEEALNSALRGAELTKRLLAFARQQPLTARTVNLNEVLPNMIGMLSRTLGERIKIDSRLAPVLWPTQVDPSQLEDALLNLAINARDAMPKGGDLLIETANVHLDERQAAVQADILPGDYVTMSVTDTGTGIPPELIERVIEPFFTTKDAGQGTGLGLSMIYGFARQSGGHLSIYSEVGIGTTIRLYFPRQQATVEPAGPVSTAAASSPTGGESILVVDDNAELRRVAVRVLTKLGYQVSEAADGHEALALIKAGERRFDLLFSDLGLPHGLDGADLAAAARLLAPGLKVLFTTGYGVDRRNGSAKVDPAILLRKPYRSQELAERIRAVLDAPKAN
jgi:signal transduction histidine kinase